ncbi:MAG: aspartate ammonia-lyase [Pseudolabrys sp.]
MTESASRAYRTECDFLGERQIPAGALYGIQTLRASENFQLSGISICAFPTFIRSFLMVKKAAAFSNNKLGALSGEKFRAITRACDDLMEEDLNDNFIVDVLQGGAGTSTNMNVNEVIANRAIHYLGGNPGDYALMHPVDDVNMSQSTNDAYPTAARLALLLSSGSVVLGLDALIDAFEAKAREFSHIVKLGRTQLQDAVPIYAGQEFGAFAAALRDDRTRIIEAAQLFARMNLGGTAVGTGLNASAHYARHALDELSRLSGIELHQSKDLLAASWGTGDFVTFSAALRRMAVTLSKVANDLRLLCSGPRGGFGEIALPPLQPGSSIMPGKVNPVIPEAVNQVCFQVIGNDVTITMAAEAGQLQLNAFLPVIIANVLTSVGLLARASELLTASCVTGIAINEERCHELVHASIGLATALVPAIGYDKAASVAKEALRKRKPVREVALGNGLDKATLDQLLDPASMIRSSGQDSRLAAGETPAGMT